MANFSLDLNETERAILDAYRETFGYRTLAEAFRAMLRRASEREAVALILAEKKKAP